MGEAEELHPGTFGFKFSGVSCSWGPLILKAFSTDKNHFRGEL